MLLVKNSADLPKTDQPIVLAMGCFDGVHIGHQKVISTAVEQAKKLGGVAWVFTFSPHPAKVLCPDKAPLLISAEPCRLRQVDALGVRGIIEMPFTLEFARLAPAAFLSDLCETLPNLAGIVCGQDWSFGYKAAGNLQLLEEFGAQHGFTATAVPHVLCDGKKISSTQIRQAVSLGDIPLAEKLLGRPFSIFGTVVHGEKIGRELGFPTANVDPENELIPADGIYAAYTWVDGKKFRSAVFIGSRATFNDHRPVIESYLMDFDGDLYGQSIEVCLVEKTRGVTPFPSKEALIEQIEKDIHQIRKILETT